MSMKFESYCPTPYMPISAHARNQWMLVVPSVPNRSNARSVFTMP